MVFPSKCNIYAYGPLHILTVSLSIAATALTYYSTFDCHFLETTTKMEAFQQLRPEFGVRRGVGVWTVEVDGACHGWPSEETLDVPTCSARIFTMVVCLFSLLLLIMLMVPCVSKVGGTAYMQKLAQFLLLMGVLHSTSFVLLKADICTSVNVCELDSTSYVSISASAMWILASFLAFLVRAKPVERKSIQRRSSRSPLTPEGSLQDANTEMNALEAHNSTTTP